MTDLALDLATHDLALPGALVYEKDAVLQALRIRLGFFRGEWFLDTAAGVPYFQQLFTKLPRGTAEVDAVLKDAVLGTPGVRSLKAWNARFVEARTYRVDFTVDTVFGTMEDSWQA